jgi:parvulin-like peptidyl-prolyl isomerase
MKKYTILTFIIPFFFFSCSSKSKDDDYIARVGNKTLTAEELSLIIPETSDYQPITKKQIDSYISNWVKKEVLFQKAKEYHFDKDKTIQLKIENFKKEMVIDLFFKYYMQINVTINEEEIGNYYLENERCFIRDTKEAMVNHVLVQDFEGAKEIRDVLQSQNREKIGNLYDSYKFEAKIIKEGDAIEEIDKTIFENQSRRVLGPIATDYGYHIIEVIAIYDEGSTKPIEQVRDEIIQRLTQAKIQQNYNNFVDSLMSLADVEIDENNLLKFLGDI